MRLAVLRCRFPAALVALLRAGSRDPAFAFARVLAFASVGRARALALALAAVGAKTFDLGLLALRLRGVGYHRLGHKDDANRGSQNCACELEFIHFSDSKHGYENEA
ncbi:MAG TPA: hypothetical protein VJN94_11330 [Candidatus Binataceae bacterium]|nr:hypothetical protein [Candidatus Binataceae bacterium]